MKEKILLISGFIFIFIFACYVFFQLPANPPKITDGNIHSTKDFRHRGQLKEVTVNIYWFDKPSPNVLCKLLDKDFGILAVEKTDSSGVCKFNRGNLTGDYYIKIEYNASFVEGGIEAVKDWYLIKFGCSSLQCDTLNITIKLKPAIWSDKPTMAIE